MCGGDNSINVLWPKHCSMERISNVGCAWYGSGCSETDQQVITRSQNQSQLGQSLPIQKYFMKIKTKWFFGTQITNLMRRPIDPISTTTYIISNGQTPQIHFLNKKEPQILVEKSMITKLFTTSFHNFLSRSDVAERDWWKKIVGSCISDV